MRRLGFVLIPGLIMLATVGCGPSDPLDRVVDAGSATAFNIWKSQSTGRLSPQHLRDLDEVVQELKLAVMAGREATGADAIEEAVRAKIDKHTLRDALRLGYESKIKRLEVERKGLMIATEQNGRLVTRPGDTESSDYLKRFQEKQNTRLQAAESEFRSAQEKLQALGGAPEAKQP